MNNASDYITGDDMIALLLTEGGDEGPTFDPADRSRDAVIARNRDLFSRPGMARDAVVDYYDVCLLDHDALLSLGLIRLNHACPGQSYLLTDAGAALAAALI